MTVSDLTRETVALHLVSAENRDAERLLPALAGAEAWIEAHTDARAAGRAVNDFRAALVAAGAAALDGGDPQRVEDALIAAQPDTPLSERVFRQAWLLFVDHLARSGDKPPFGGSGKAETWAWVARSRDWPHVDPGNVVARTANLFGEGLQVVVARGAGRSAFLAAVRRALLAQHGGDALVPPVMPASLDETGGLLRPYIERGPLDDELRKVLPQIRFGEDLVGLLGRLGDKAPVALLLDDAHLQSRAVLLGLPLFLEPAAGRKALLVLAGPDNPADDGPLADILQDAAGRNALTQLQLPAIDPEFVRHLLAAYDRPSAQAERVLQFTQGPFFGGERLRIARAVLQDAEFEAFSPEALLPKHERAREVLAVAAIEGPTFHALSVGAVFQRTEDDLEDLLHDDEYEIEGALVGTCEAAVPAQERQWVDLQDGLHPVFSFGDVRLALALRAGIPQEHLAPRAGALRDVLLEKYGPQRVWQIADRLWKLDAMAGRNRRVETLLIGAADPGRIEFGFRRLLPVLQAQQPFVLALARLYGAAMEAGQLGLTQGQAQFADQAFQAAAAAAQRLGRPGPAGEAIARVAELRLALAQTAPAKVALETAQQLLDKAQHHRSAARLGMLRAEIHVLDGEIDAALAALDATREALTTHKDPAHAALALVRRGRLTWETGRHDEAEALAQTALAEADASQDPRARAAARMARAYIAGERQQLDAAMKWLNEAAQLFNVVRMPLHIVEAAAAGLQRRHGAAADAEKRLRAVGEAFKKAQAGVQFADAWHELARALMDQDKFTDALSALGETLEVRRVARDRFGLVRLHDDLGRAAKGQGDALRAAQEFARGRCVAERLGLAHRLGAFDAELELLRETIDALPDTSLAAVLAAAKAEHDALEAQWAAPPEPQAPPAAETP